MPSFPTHDPNSFRTHRSTHTHTHIFLGIHPSIHPSTHPILGSRYETNRNIEEREAGGEKYLAPPPDVAPVLGGGGVGVLAEVAVLGAGGLQGDAEVDVEEADVAARAHAGRVRHLVVRHRAVRRHVLVQAARAAVGERAADGDLSTSSKSVTGYTTGKCDHVECGI